MGETQEEEKSEEVPEQALQAVGQASKEARPAQQEEQEWRDQMLEDVPGASFPKRCTVCGTLHEDPPYPDVILCHSCNNYVCSSEECCRPLDTNICQNCQVREFLKMIREIQL